MEIGHRLQAAIAVVVAPSGLPLAVFVLLAAWFSCMVHNLPPGTEISGAVLGVSGVLVALVIPAASLAGDYLEKLRRAIAAAERRGKHRHAAAKEARAELHKLGFSLWRSLVYMVLSLPLAMLGLLRLPGIFGGVPLWQVAVAASLASILVATISLLPFSWRVYDRGAALDKILEDTEGPEFNED